MASYTVRVPIRTFQTFIVDAHTPAHAKRIVHEWLKGKRSESDEDGHQLEVMDDIGQETEWLQPRNWEVQKDREFNRDDVDPGAGA